MNLPYGVTMEYRNGLGIVLNYSDQPYQFALTYKTRQQHTKTTSKLITIANVKRISRHVRLRKRFL